ncbi:type II secretion system protein M [Thalassotalea sp. Y01]|uniref:type II secretion system protein GspM n=1 Tax=Thalassotalea sp. Y01 TaxID=2729613 RepID=UPI00145F04B5|nr:type II secretion system protein M [Thalassotalea sp. Y01]NMP17010.1 type II secretion system protein M [Thalassotalea sp. Y01]
MKQWWLGLNPREQKLASIMGAVVAIFIFYFLIWQPLNNSVEKAQQKLERQQQLAAWVDENLPKLQALQKAGGIKSTGGSLSSIVNRTAKRQSIAIARMQPQGDDLQVWIDEVPFNTFVSWLNNLNSNEGVLIESIDITEGNAPGTIAVRRLQLAKAG